MEPKEFSYILFLSFLRGTTFQNISKQQASISEFPETLFYFCSFTKRKQKRSRRAALATGRQLIEAIIFSGSSLKQAKANLSLRWLE